MDPRIKDDEEGMDESVNEVCKGLSFSDIDLMVFNS